MANTNTSDRIDTSVLFNLQELMRIEAERVQADATAERAVRERRLRQQQESEQRAAAAHEAAQRHDREQQQRAQEAQVAENNAREAALLAVRLKIEAEQRLESQQRELEHVRVLELAVAQASGPSPWRQALWVLAVTASLVVGGYVALVAPMLTQLRVAEAHAVAMTAAHATELARLREQAATQPGAVADPVEAVPVPVDDTVVVPPPMARRTRPSQVDRPREAAAPVPAIDVLDSDDDDPLIGLGDLGAMARPGTTKRVRDRR